MSIAARRLQRAHYSSGGGGIGDSTGTVARRVYDFRDSVAVNIHIKADGPYSVGGAAIRDKMQNLGIWHYRNGDTTG